MKEQSIRLQMPAMDQMDSSSLAETFQQMHCAYMEAVLFSELIPDDMKGRVLFSVRERLKKRYYEGGVRI